MANATRFRDNRAMTRIVPLEFADRAELSEMLAGEVDFPHELLYLYNRKSGPDETYIARRGRGVDGVLTGTFRHNFADSRAFGGFKMTGTSHALLTRMHVRHSARFHGIGKALVEQFAVDAIERGCHFIGGYLDDNGDVPGRSAFYKHLGFSVSDRQSFGADPEQILESTYR